MTRIILIMTAIILWTLMLPADARAAQDSSARASTDWQNRTASRTIEQDSNWCGLGFDGFSNRKSGDMSYKHDLPAQWHGITWEPNEWAENWPEEQYGTLWTPERVLGNLFSKGYFERQYMCDGKPYLKVGAPFFDLSELDQIRALRLLAEESGVLNVHHRISLYSAPHHRLIGAYSKSGLTFN